MGQKKVKNKKHPKRTSWARWLKGQKLSLPREDTHCRDPTAITDRPGDQHFVGAIQGYNPSVMPVFPKKPRRKSKRYRT